MKKNIKKKFSVSAIILMILIIIRFIGQSTYVFRPKDPLEIYLPITFLFLLIYLIIFLGLFLKTRWALVMILIIAMIDMSSAILVKDSLSVSVLFGAILIDQILIFLVFDILKRN